MFDKVFGVLTVMVLAIVVVSMLIVAITQGIETPSTEHSNKEEGLNAAETNAILHSVGMY